MSEEHSSQDPDKPPYPTGPEDEHTEFVDGPATPDSEDPETGRGVGEGATSGADQPDNAAEEKSGEGAADEKVREQAGSERAEIARPPRGAPQPRP